MGTTYIWSDALGDIDRRVPVVFVTIFLPFHPFHFQSGSRSGSSYSRVVFVCRGWLVMVFIRPLIQGGTPKGKPPMLVPVNK
jgi:hypothetical protein